MLCCILRGGPYGYDPRPLEMKRPQLGPSMRPWWDFLYRELRSSCLVGAEVNVQGEGSQEDQQHQCHLDCLSISCFRNPRFGDAGQKGFKVSGFRLQGLGPLPAARPGEDQLKAGWVRARFEPDPGSHSIFWSGLGA